MKVGNLVKFHDRLERQPGLVSSHLRDGPRAGDTFLVVERMAARGGRPSDPKWAQWKIINMQTGKIYIQIARDLNILEDNNV